VSDFGGRPPILRVSVSAVALVAAIAIVVHFFRHGNPSPPAVPSATGNAAAPSTSVDQRSGVVRPYTSESQILAACQPHLGTNTGSVPNIDVSEMPNPAAVRLNVRFWVNGDGFVTQAFVTGRQAHCKRKSLEFPDNPDC
jgi:hypothetical protein